jgi:hypothetical protein
MPRARRSADPVKPEANEAPEAEAEAPESDVPKAEAEAAPESEEPAAPEAEPQGEVDGAADAEADPASDDAEPQGDAAEADGEAPETGADGASEDSATEPEEDEDQGDGLEFPFDEGEEVLAERVDDDNVLWFVTSHGRKVGISEDGWASVVTGPDIDVVVPPAPKPGRKSWKERRD